MGLSALSEHSSGCPHQPSTPTALTYLSEKNFLRGNFIKGKTLRVHRESIVRSYNDFKMAIGAKE